MQVVLAWVLIQGTVADNVGGDGDTGDDLLPQEMEIKRGGDEDNSDEIPYFWGAAELAKLTANPAGTNAERFVNFMISKVAQQYLASQIYEYPLVDGVKASRLLTPMAEIKKPSINLSDLADLSGTSAILKELGALP